MCLPLYHQNDKDVTLSDIIKRPNSNSDFPGLTNIFSSDLGCSSHTLQRFEVQGLRFQICNHFDRAAVHSLLVAEQARAFLGYTNVSTSWSLPSQDQSGQMQCERSNNVNQTLFSLS